MRTCTALGHDNSAEEQSLLGALLAARQVSGAHVHACMCTFVLGTLLAARTASPCSHVHVHRCAYIVVLRVPLLQEAMACARPSRALHITHLFNVCKFHHRLPALVRARRVCFVVACIRLDPREGAFLLVIPCVEVHPTFACAVCVPCVAVQHA